MLNIYNSVTLLPTHHGVPTEEHEIYGAAQRLKKTVMFMGSFRNNDF